MEDEEIILRIRERGQDEAALTEELIKKYIPLVNREIRFLFLAGAEADDLAQEGMIGLYRAICSYRPGGDSRFITFATTCIRNCLRDAIKAAGRLKNQPLNSFISLSGTDDTEAELALSEMIGGPDTENPEAICLRREERADLEKEMERILSPMEKQTAALYLEGISRKSIAEQLGKDEKAVSNALSRIRKKLSAYMEAEHVQ